MLSKSLQKILTTQSLLNKEKIMPKIELRFIFGVIFISVILLRAYAVKKDVKTNSEASVETKNEPSNKEIS